MQMVGVETIWELHTLTVVSFSQASLSMNI